MKTLHLISGKGETETEIEIEASLPLKLFQMLTSWVLIVRQVAHYICQRGIRMLALLAAQSCSEGVLQTLK